MYAIEMPNDGREIAYAATIAPKIQSIILDYLNNGRHCTFTFRNGDSIEIGVSAKSISHKFLVTLSDIEKLKSFLIMKPQMQLAYIKSMHKWATPDDILFQGLTKKTYKKYYKGDPATIDHFNEIMYDIFVVRGYENSTGESGFDKRQFIIDSQLSICPYCSEENIEPTDNTKKQIDHFLPKRQYPFFALSFYNLIPSCGTCNEIVNKGTNDPILSKNGTPNAIINPYLFRPGLIRFHLKLLKADAFNNADFELILGFLYSSHQYGYNEFFDISDRQARHRGIAASDYRRLMKFKAEHFYDQMEMDPEWLQNAYDTVLSLDPLENKPSKEIHHRMRHDVFEQFTKQRKPGMYYTKQSPDNAIELA